jgi:hypothetical protein
MGTTYVLFTRRCIIPNHGFWPFWKEYTEEVLSITLGWLIRYVVVYLGEVNCLGQYVFRTANVKMQNHFFFVGNTTYIDCELIKFFILTNMIMENNIWKLGN